MAMGYRGPSNREMIAEETRDIVSPKPESFVSTQSEKPRESTIVSNVIKVATPDVIKAVQEKAYSNEKEVEPLFEQFGLQEILSVTRNSSMNIVNGQNVTYQPIKNLASITLQYNPLNILPLQSADTVFKNFSISLEDKVVDDGNGTGPSKKAEYLDEQNNLVINVTGLGPDELVEIESLSIESTINDTIYEGATS
jgi:hypothetical protein